MVTGIKIIIGITAITAVGDRAVTGRGTMAIAAMDVTAMRIRVTGVGVMGEMTIFTVTMHSGPGFPMPGIIDGKHPADGTATPGRHMTQLRAPDGIKATPEKRRTAAAG